MTKNLKVKSFWLGCIFLGISTTAMAELVERVSVIEKPSIVEKFEEVPATFKLEKTTKEDVKPNTIVDSLMTLSGKSIEDLVDADGKTIEYFSITYRVPVDITAKKSSNHTTPVTQYGLYRTLNPEARTDLGKHVSPFRITVRYNRDNPEDFKMIVKNTVYVMPALVKKL